MKQSSLARILASRANGAKSKGPITEAGKRRSSMNALQHGLAAKSVLIPGESADRLRDHQESMTHDLAPVNYLEEFIASRVTAAAWKLLRADGYESALVRDQLSKTAPGPDAAITVARAWADSQAFRATDYESRHQRHFQTNLQTFYALTLLRGGADRQCTNEENQQDASGFPQLANEPRPENATLESGEDQAA